MQHSNNNTSNPETRSLFARAMLRQLCCEPQATSSPEITTRATVSTTTTTEVVEWDLDRVRWLVLQPPTAIMHALDLSFLEATALLGEAASVIAPLRRSLSNDGGAAAGGTTEKGADGWGKGAHPLEEWGNRGPGSLFSMSDSGDVDSMLGGGLPHGFLVELVGRAGCGKSILLMSQVARSLARHYARRWVGSRFASHSRTPAWQQQQQWTTGGSPRCVWIDADGDFSAAVMEKLLRAFAVRELMTLLPPLLLQESGLTEEHEEQNNRCFADVEEEVEAAHQLVVDVAMEHILVVQKVRTVLDFQAFLPTLAEFWTASDAVAHPHRRHVPTQPTQRFGPAAATTTASSTTSQRVPPPRPPPTPLPPPSAARPVKRESTSAAAAMKAPNDAPTPNHHHLSEPPPPLLYAANRGVLVIDSFANLVRREYRGHPLETFERHDTVLSLMTSLKQLAAEQKLLVWMINHLPDGASHLSRRNATLGEPQHDDAFEESDPETNEGPGESRRSSTSSNRFAPVTKRGTKTHHQGGGGARAGLGVTFFHAVNIRFQIQEAVVGGEEGGRWVPLLRVIKSSLGPPMVFQLTAWHAEDTQRLVRAMVAAAAATNGSSSEGSPPAGAAVPHSVSSVDRGSRGVGDGGVGGGGVIAVDVEWASPDVLRETFGWSSHSSVLSPSFASGNVSMTTRSFTEQQQKQRPTKDRKRSRVPPELHCASMGMMMTWQQSGTALDTFSYMRIPHFITQ